MKEMVPKFRSPDNKSQQFTEIFNPQPKLNSKLISSPKKVQRTFSPPVQK